PPPQRQRAGIVAAGVLGPPHLAAIGDGDGRVEHDRVRPVSGIQRRGIDEGLERRAGLPPRLRRAVEHRVLEREAADQRLHAARIGVHRHEGALNLWDLAHRPAFVLALYMDDVARLPQIAGAARGAGLRDAPDPLALARETQGRGAVLLRARNVPDPHPRAVLEDLEHHAQMPAIYVARRIDIGQPLAPALG